MVRSGIPCHAFDVCNGTWSRPKWTMVHLLGVLAQESGAGGRSVSHAVAMPIGEALETVHETQHTAWLCGRGGSHLSDGLGLVLEPRGAPPDASSRVAEGRRQRARGGRSSFSRSALRARLYHERGVWGRRAALSNLGCRQRGGCLRSALRAGDLRGGCVRVGSAQRRHVSGLLFAGLQRIDVVPVGVEMCFGGRERRLQAT